MGRLSRGRRYREGELFAKKVSYKIFLSNGVTSVSLRYFYFKETWPSHNVIASHNFFIELLCNLRAGGQTNWPELKGPSRDDGPELERAPVSQIIQRQI